MFKVLKYLSFHPYIKKIIVLKMKLDILIKKESITINLKIQK